MRIPKPIVIYSVKQLREMIQSVAEVCSHGLTDNDRIVFMSLTDGDIVENIVAKYDTMYDTILEEQKLGNVVDFLTIDEFVDIYRARM